MRVFAFAIAFCAATSANADTVYDFAAKTPQLATFAATMRQTGIDDALGNRGPYTIFAPTDAAFAALPAQTLATLLHSSHREELVELLTCHMAPTQAVKAAANGAAQVIRTVGGCTLTLHREGESLMVRDQKGQEHRIAMASLKQSNGVVHVLDSLILPGS